MRALITGLLAATVAVPVHAQSLTDTFRSLFTFGDCGEPLCLDVNAAIHGSHFNPSVTQGQNQTLGFLTGAIGLSVASVPFTAAASGVTYRFEGGAPIATTVSSGPIFADRAQTLGSGRFLIGANVTGISFSKVRGETLDDLVLRFTHQNVGDPALGNPTFERDYIEVDSRIDLSLLVTTLFATFGISDRVDIGVALPLVRASLSGASDALFVQWDPQQSPHYFGSEANRQIVASASAEGSAFGIGDVAARVKFFLTSGRSAGAGLVADVRLPTGKEEDFLGSGATILRALVVGSGRFGSFAPHINTGVLISSAERQSNRFLATIGFDQLLGPQVTLAGDLVGSFQLGANQLTLPEPVIYTAPDAQPATLPLTTIPAKSDHFVDASIGAKLLAGSDFRVVANLLVPLTNGGVRPTVMWTFGLERTF